MMFITYLLGNWFQNTFNDFRMKDRHFVLVLYRHLLFIDCRTQTHLKGKKLIKEKEIKLKKLTHPHENRARKLLKKTFVDKSWMTSLGCQLPKNIFYQFCILTIGSSSVYKIYELQIYWKRLKTRQAAQVHNEIEWYVNV